MVKRTICSFFEARTVLNDVDLRQINVGELGDLAKGRCLDFKIRPLFQPSDVYGRAVAGHFADNEPRRAFTRGSVQLASKREFTALIGHN
jgi:hypothetical protein